MRISSALTFAAACACAAASAWGQEACWTRFRGPNGTGIAAAATLPVTWTEKDYRWKVGLPGGGHSSPVVWGEKVFVTSAEKETATRIVLCLRASDGAVVWERRYPSKRHRVNGDNSYAASTPAADGERVYLYWTTPEEITVRALDHAGEEVWSRDLGPFDSLHGSGASPALFGDILVLGNDQKGTSSLLGLDRKTGETRWKIDRRADRAAYSTPCAYRPEGRAPELIFTASSHGVTSVDPSSGSVNWELGDAFPERVVCSPVVASGLIIGSCGEGGVGRRLVAVRPGTKGGAAPELVYDLRRDVPYVPTPLAKDGLVFLLTDGGKALCVRSATGEKVWEERLGARFYGSFVWAGGRLYALSRAGDAFVLAASEKFELLGRNALGEGSHSTPAVAGGVMYLRTFSHLIAIGG